MKTFKRLVLTGPFTEEDVKLLLDAVRYCEKKQPDKPFTVSMEPLEEQTTEEAKQFLKDSFPTVKGLPVEVEVFNNE